MDSVEPDKKLLKVKPQIKIRDQDQKNICKKRQ